MLLGVFDIYILSPMSLRKWFGVYVEPSKISSLTNTPYLRPAEELTVISHSM